MALRHNRYAVPTGRVRLSNSNGNHVPTREARKAAAARSFVATCQLRERLADTEIVLLDDSWSHVRDGIVVAKFPTLGAAVEAI